MEILTTDTQFLPNSKPTLKSINALQWLGLLNNTLEDTQAKSFGQSCSLMEAFREVCILLHEAKAHDHAVWWAANGGSVSLASHFAQDLFNKHRIRSMAFTDAAMLTCQANDFGYEDAYARMLDVFAKEGDILVAISSSGKSKNILKAIEKAQDKHLKVVGFSGFESTNPLFKISCEASFFLDSKLYGIVETGHGALLHGLVETL
ncbi:MAG: SIS domain-containing protein [Deltaproteobacteria bacterium]|nr:SIS domain-containing protein [Deltaproteobacteria bacterium]